MRTTATFVRRAREVQDTCHLIFVHPPARFFLDLAHAAPPRRALLCAAKVAALRWLMGCSASTQQPAIASEERLGLPRAKRDPVPADKLASGDSPSRRFEAPFSGASAEAGSLCGLKVSKLGELQWASFSPAMLVLEDFLTGEECDGLVALASGGAPPARAQQGRAARVSRTTPHRDIRSPQTCVARA